MTIIYDNSFNINEWYIIINLVGMSFLVWVLRKKFSILENIAFYVYGIAYGMFYDHTISVEPWDFYDVNDTSSYQVIDFLSYIMYGPYSFLFVYLYAKFNIKGFMNLFYVLGWTIFSLLIEWFSMKIGFFHYEKGFKMYWSLPIYIFAQSMLIIFYHIVKRTTPANRSNLSQYSR